MAYLIKIAYIISKVLYFNHEVIYSVVVNTMSPVYLFVHTATLWSQHIYDQRSCRYNRLYAEDTYSLRRGSTHRTK